jgi:hypothetical protein
VTHNPPPRVSARATEGAASLLCVRGKKVHSGAVDAFHPKFIADVQQLVVLRK